MAHKAATDAKEKIVCLISGGIDSPVAAWMAMKKGYVPVFVYYDNSPFSDETTKQRAMEIIMKLGKRNAPDKIKLYIVPHGNDLTDILRNCPRNLTCILCRRMMYRIAEKIAEMEDADGIITGEIIGEHASQTLTNLRIESMALSQISVLRPLAGMNKTEVENFARKIGTFEASTKPASCCTGPPPKPRTRAKLEEITKAEEHLNVNEMISRDLKAATILMV